MRSMKLETELRPLWQFNLRGIFLFAPEESVSLGICKANMLNNKLLRAMSLQLSSPFVPQQITVRFIWGIFFVVYSKCLARKEIFFHPFKNIWHTKSSINFVSRSWLSDSCKKFMLSSLLLSLFTHCSPLFQWGETNEGWINSDAGDMTSLLTHTYVTPFSSHVIYHIEHIIIDFYETSPRKG